MTKVNSRYPKSVSLVMPVYNEAEIIKEVVEKYYQQLSPLPDWEFVISEDGSTDGTKEILRELIRTHPRLRVIFGNTRVGAAQAQRNCLKTARKDIIWYSDSDNQHDPKDFTKLYRHLIDQNLDMVIGNKLPRRDPLYRILLSNILNLLVFVVYGIQSRDINSGFRLLTRSLNEEILPLTNTFPGLVLTEFTIRAKHAGYAIGQIPVTHFPRIGQSRAIKPQYLLSLISSILLAMIKLRVELWQH